MASEEAAFMTWFQAYAFFGGPLIVLLIGIGMAYWAVRDSRYDERDQHLPGE